MTRRPSLLLLLPVGLALVLCASSARAETVEVTASALNVRRGPGTGYGRVGQVARGQVYPVLARSGAWVQLHLGEGTGWSHGTYLRTSGVRTARVTAGRLNVRSGPSTRYRQVGSLTRGAPVAPVASQGSWLEIAFGGRTAWVHGAYVSGAGTAAPPVTRPVTSSGRTTSRAGFIQLPSSGPGFFGYYAASKRWGTPRLVYGIERIARRWQRERPGSGRIGIGDISLENGGPISGHASHQKGVDVDVRLVRNDGGEAATTRFQSAYSRSGTQALIDLFVGELSIKYVFFNDRNTRHTTPWPNHDNHLHVRID